MRTVPKVSLCSDVIGCHHEEPSPEPGVEETFGPTRLTPVALASSVWLTSVTLLRSI